jgi:hypothetical protein
MSQHDTGEWALKREQAVAKVHKPWKPPEPEANRQRLLLTGLDCLPDQQSLFDTDGEPEH